MSKLANAPLVEAIFELKWGEKSPGEFEYSQVEQQLLPGKVSVSANAAGYSLVKPLQKNNSTLLPYVPTHRFLMAEEKWPCFQLGLGVFTVNQINEGYDWSTFKISISEGLNVLNEANSTIFNENITNATVALNYQDAFYQTETKTIEDYLEKHFQVTIKLPKVFLENEHISDNINSINVNLSLHSIKPKGIVNILIANGMIDSKPGLILRTSIESKLSTIFDGKDFLESIMTWSEEAHDIQRHAFHTLIEPSAYKDKK